MIVCAVDLYSRILLFLIDTQKGKSALPMPQDICSTKRLNIIPY